MQGLQIITKGQSIRSVEENTSGNTMCLKIQENGIEVAKFSYAIASHGGFTLPKDQSMEVYYILEGCFTIRDSQGGVENLRQGDMFNLTADSPFLTFETEPNTSFLIYTTESSFLVAEQKINVVNEIIGQLQEYDGYTLEHSRRVANYVIEIARVMQYPAEDMNVLLNAARYHDVGKTEIDHEILTKPGKLTPQEYDQIKKHSIYSKKILKPIIGARGARIAGAHHERPDGRGYPEGLFGEEIPIEARMLAVADAYDAMTTNRGYNQVKTQEEGIQELYHFCDSQFDRNCVDAFVKVLKDVDHIEKL